MGIVTDVGDGDEGEDGTGNGRVVEVTENSRRRSFLGQLEFDKKSGQPR